MRAARGMLDRYTLQARLIPGILVILPAGVSLSGWLPGWRASLPLVGVVWLACAVLLAQLSRGRGKRIQSYLYSLWGGPPSTRKLRHRDSDLGQATLEILHARLSSSLGIRLPTAEQEAGDPQAADEAYALAVRSLRELTRDPNAFPLIHAENINYGFRRNLYGMKPAGIMVGIISLCLSLIVVWECESDTRASTAWSGIVVAVVALAFWLLVVRPSWVRVVADEYADRLLGAVEALWPR